MPGLQQAATAGYNCCRERRSAQTCTLANGENMSNSLTAMRSAPRFVLVANLFAAIVPLACGTIVARAADYDVGSIHIAQPWSRVTPKGAKVGAGYMTITNKGTTPDKVNCVSDDASAQSYTDFRQSRKCRCRISNPRSRRYCTRHCERRRNEDARLRRRDDANGQTLTTTMGMKPYRRLASSIVGLLIAGAFFTTFALAHDGSEGAPVILSPMDGRRVG